MKPSTTQPTLLPATTRDRDDGIQRPETYTQRYHQQEITEQPDLIRLHKRMTGTVHASSENGRHVPGSATQEGLGRRRNLGTGKRRRMNVTAGLMKRGGVFRTGRGAGSGVRIVGHHRVRSHDSFAQREMNLHFEAGSEGAAALPSGTIAAAALLTSRPA